MNSINNLRFLWVYSASDEWTVAWHERNLRRRSARGFDVKNFCITPPSLGRKWIPYPELDRLWKTGHKPLMEMYEALAAQLVDRDVMVLYNGANLHPKFVESFKTILKVYTFGDPESETLLSQPIAPSFDLHLVNQFSEIQRFSSWGLEHVYFWPLGSLTSEDDTPDITAKSIMDLSRRPFPVVLFGEYNRFRSQRLDTLAKSFPEAYLAGDGWGRGRADWSEMWRVYRKSQIGWNIHNTTGFNFRTYELPAYGIMQICDNKSDLGSVFKVGEEVIGFDSIEECIELTHYYKAHREEQRQIAMAGWRRWKQDYTPDKVWNKLVAIVDSHRRDFTPDMHFTGKEAMAIKASLSSHRRRTFFKRSGYELMRPLVWFRRKIVNLFIRVRKWTPRDRVWKQIA